MNRPEITFRPFQPDDLRHLLLRPEQAAEQSLISAGPAFPETAIPTGGAETAWIDGQALACAGLITLLPHRAVAWAYIDTALPRRAWPVITARVEAGLTAAHAQGVKRIEATCIAGARPLSRWLERLGFIRETPVPMPCYGPDGAAHYLYSRVRL